MVFVLVTDDEPKLGRWVEEVMRLAGHRVHREESGSGALTALDNQAFDLVITDLMLPGASGLEVLKAARGKVPAPDVIVMTAYGSTESAVEAMKAGAADYLTKPFTMDELRLRVARVVDHRQQRLRNARLVESLTPPLVAKSPAMAQVVAQARQVAVTDATVLLQGESGAGKSQLARHIHYSSPRSAHRLVELHCAALPEAALERALFGDGTKGGMLAEAAGGTVLLDEIGDVTATTQLRLLRLLEERTYVPVGAAESVRADVRVIAATNRDLPGLVKSGAFREDLYYRLNVFGITVPPLRERRDDVLPLAEAGLSARGVPASKLTDLARQRLQIYGWPGNVRELGNVLERALILAGPDPIDAEHLGPAGAEPNPTSADTLAGLLIEGFNLDLCERDLIHRAIELAGGNKAAAARLLGITRRRLYSRIKSLDERTQSNGEDSGDI
ncbi:MAG: sigma-54-dependent Fis family transcriptional regulator [Myxococcales bacterium]|nr:sigma-54-dependent Fis family transcriptional regulator [Myxococcales bacterium]MCB9648983.1 sigma-54-dependent Fis family transcriptional regulator [Deltaproteobacteria bacterium]